MVIFPMGPYRNALSEELATGVIGIADAVRRAFARAVAQPAKSAVATAAMGMIMGSIARVALVRHSGPAQARAAECIDGANCNSDVAENSVHSGKVPQTATRSSVR